MARTALTVNQLSLDGVRVDNAAAANVDGHSVPNTGSETVILYIKNGGGAPITVTFKTNHTVAGITLDPKTATITNAQDGLFSPFPKTPFNQADGDIHIDFSAVTTVTIKAYKV